MLEGSRFTSGGSPLGPTLDLVARQWHRECIVHEFSGHDIAIRIKHFLDGFESGATFPTLPLNDIDALLHRALDQIQRIRSQQWEMARRATVLRHPTDMIADDHGITSNAVRQAKSRVLRRPRKQLSER